MPSASRCTAGCPAPAGAARPHLRSDHADDSARPEVRLELTLDGRRFEVTRSPEWQRPKKRGVGTTPEKGSVALRERIRPPAGRP